MGTLSRSLFVPLIAPPDEVLGFTLISCVFGQYETSEVLFLCVISFGFPFNPTYEFDPRKS